MHRLLITGFEPFGGQPINPSWEAVRRLPDQIGGWEIHGMQIPVVFGKAAETVWEAAGILRPQAILCVGQAGGRRAITPEMVGINLRNGTDNEGASFVDAPVRPEGPAAYFATVPVRKMAEAIQAAGVAGAVSYTAGTYVCNDTLYELLHRCQGTGIRAGFIHIPFLPEQAREGENCMALDDMVEGLTAAISVMD